MLSLFGVFVLLCLDFVVFFFKQKTAYEMRISDWSSDVCSSDLPPGLGKTTLAGIIANEMGTNLVTTSGPAIERGADLMGILTNLAENDVMFIRSEERRVGKECVSTCRSRWSP